MKTIAIALLIGVACAGAARAQTAAQMEYERQQREYWRAQEQQRQEQQRQQQLMQQNAQRQQDESARAMRSAMPQGGGGAPAAGGGYAPGAAGPGGTAGAQLEQARQAWLKRPPLAPERNPLLGAWTRPQSASTDPFAQLGALMKGGVCEVFFSGDAVFEFRNDVLMGRDKRTQRAELLDHVEYRGDAQRVVVIPKTTLKLIVFDFDGPDRIRWAGQGCTLSRVSAGARKASAGGR